MSRINFVLSWVEHGTFYNLGAMCLIHWLRKDPSIFNISIEEGEPIKHYKGWLIEKVKSVQ